MLINFHLYLAGCLQKSIYKAQAIKFNSNFLQLGSIMPDLIPDKRNMAHYLPDSYSFVMNGVKEVRGGEGKSIEEISYQLGVITHFLADFFCLAHNDEILRKNLWKHFKYEFALHHTLTSVHLIENKNCYLDPLNIEEWLKKEHYNYLKVNSGVVTDVLYIQKICYSVCISLLTSIESIQKKIA